MHSWTALLTCRSARDWWLPHPSIVELHLDCLWQPNPSLYDGPHPARRCCIQISRESQHIVCGHGLQPSATPYCQSDRIYPDRHWKIKHPNAVMLELIASCILHSCFCHTRDQPRTAMPPDCSRTRPIAANKKNTNKMPKSYGNRSNVAKWKNRNVGHTVGDMPSASRAFISRLLASRKISKRPSLDALQPSSKSSEPRGKENAFRVDYIGILKEICFASLFSWIFNKYKWQTSLYSKPNTASSCRERGTERCREEKKRKERCAGDLIMVCVCCWHVSWLLLKAPSSIPILC